MQKQSLKKNFLMNAVLTMSSFIFPLITFPYVSRVLLPEGTGKVSFATSLVAYFLILAQLGIPTYGVRACAKVRDDRQALTRTAQELLLINLIMGAVSYVLLFLALAFVPRLQGERGLYLVVSLTIFFNCIGMEWLYKALEQYTYITIRSIIFKFVALIAMFALVHTQADYVIYGGITILAASASNLFNFFHARRYISLRPVGGYRLGRHFRAVAVFFAMACATTIYTHLDTVMLGFLATDEAVGYYNAAVRIKSILVSIVTSLGAVLLPRASYYVEHGQLEKFREITCKALNFVFLAALPMLVYFILFAKEGIFFLSGDAYAGSVVPMQIIMPTLLLIGLSNILGIQILVPMGKEKVVLLSEVAGAGVDVVCNLLLIPRYGAAGAAVSNLAAECTVLLVQYGFLRAEVRPALRCVQYGKLGLGLLAGTGASFWVSGLGLGNFPALVLSACLFFGAYGLVLLATRERFLLEIGKPLLEKLKKDRMCGMAGTGGARNQNVDLIKLLSCLAVVFLHCTWTKTPGVSLGTYQLCIFGVPCFYMASGYLLGNRTGLSWQYVGRKLLGIIRLVVVWGAIHYGGVLLLAVLREGPGGVNYLRLGVDCLQGLVKGLFQRGDLWQFWYLGTLGLLYLLLLPMQRLLGREPRRLTVCWAAMLAVSVAAQIAGMLLGAPIQARVCQTFRLWTVLQYFLLGALMPRVVAWCSARLSVKRHGVLAVAATALALVWRLVLDWKLLHWGMGEYYYDDPVTIAWVALLFSFLMRVEIGAARPLVTRLAPLTLGVYIVHVPVRNLVRSLVPVANDPGRLVLGAAVCVIAFGCAWGISKLPFGKALLKL